MTKSKTIRLDDETMIALDDLRDRLNRRPNQPRHSREGLARTVIRLAVKAPMVLRELGADVRRGMR